MTQVDTEDLILLKNVSKFYGEVLGVNRVSLSIPPGITSLVGPNGAGKTTLMNLMSGLLRPTRGDIQVTGTDPDNPEELFSKLGYCTQFDHFPARLSGFQFVYSYLLMHGILRRRAEELAWRALERLQMGAAAHRKVAGYSKGMRQRVKLAQAISHEPSVLILDEPLNGLDPVGRAEMIALFQEWAGGGKHLIISSHILHEVDLISDRVILMNGGYVVAEGDIQSVRQEMPEHPIQIMVRCDRPSRLASLAFELDNVVEAKIQEDGKGVLIRTRNPDCFFLHFNRAVLEENLKIESVLPADEDVQAVYHYLIGGNGEPS